MGWKKEISKIMSALPIGLRLFSISLVCFGYCLLCKFMLLYCSFVSSSSLSHQSCLDKQTALFGATVTSSLGWEFGLKNDATFLDIIPQDQLTNKECLQV
jgi:hypothetical protein